MVDLRQTASQQLPREEWLQKIPIALIGLAHPSTKALLHALLNHPHFRLGGVYHTGKTPLELRQKFPELGNHPVWQAMPLACQEIIEGHRGVIWNGGPDERLLLPLLRKGGLKILDLQASHATDAPFIYGLCEIFGEDIRKAYQVALPHPAATAVILALAPFLQNQLIAPDRIVCDVKSSPFLFADSVAFSDLHDQVLSKPEWSRSYAPEIRKTLQALSNQDVQPLIQHSLVPISQGVHATIYTKPYQKRGEPDFHAVLQKFYHQYPFVLPLPIGHTAELRHVWNTNQCQISVQENTEQEALVLTAVLNETGKGSVGQALQCLNLMFEVPPTQGLPLGHDLGI